MKRHPCEVCGKISTPKETFTETTCSRKCAEIAIAFWTEQGRAGVRWGNSQYERAEAILKILQDDAQPDGGGVEWCVCDSPETALGFCSACGLPWAAAQPDGADPLLPGCQECGWNDWHSPQCSQYGLPAPRGSVANTCSCHLPSTGNLCGIHDAARRYRAEKLS